MKLFTQSKYIDDVTYVASDDNAAYELYDKSKKVLAEGGLLVTLRASKGTLIQVKHTAWLMEAH